MRQHVCVDCRLYSLIVVLPYNWSYREQNPLRAAEGELHPTVVRRFAGGDAAFPANPPDENINSSESGLKPLLPEVVAPERLSAGLPGGVLEPFGKQPPPPIKVLLLWWGSSSTLAASLA